jgi:mono/diheme cytochrome c family protein
VRVALGLLLVATALPAQQLTPFQREKTKQILRTQLPCLGCHELDGEGGRSAPSLTTVGERRSAKYIRGMIEDPQATKPGSAMPRHKVAPQVGELVARLLAEGAKGPDSPTDASIRSPGSASGSQLYEVWCASCHGVTGKGDGPNAKYLPTKPATHADGLAMSKRPDDSLYDVIAVGGVPYGRSPRMPAFGATLTPVEIRALVAQIRTLCKCEGPGWARDGKKP